MMPLLSFIVPTKNRQYTAVFAVASILNIISDEIEVVVQDCSDDDTLKGILTEKFQADSRIKYFYSDNAPSLTENWNVAISHAMGKFICGIGDDDAVLPYCFDMAKWMEKNAIDTVLPMHITYIWKDAYIGSFSNSRLSFSKQISGRLCKVDVAKEFTKKALNCGFGYTEDLPNLYHGIVRRSLLETHKNKTGHYLASTSFDVYNAMILPSYTDSFLYIDYPLTIRGVSGKSNANRIISKKSYLHFNEFRNLHMPENLPKILNGEVSIAESTIVALRDTGRTDLVENMNLAIVYGKTAALNLGKSMSFYEQYKRAEKTTGLNNRHFFIYFYRFFKERCKSEVKNTVLKVIFKMIPGADYFIDKLVSRRRVVAPDILAAIQLLQQHLEANALSIKYNEPVNSLPPRKDLWE